MRILLTAVAISTLAACSSVPRSDREGEPKSDMSEVVRRSERVVLETRTLSGLVALEHALKEFVQGEGKIPKKLDELIPKYLGELPEVSLDILEHKDNNRVRNYPPEAIAAGQINGALLEDSGKWGYAYSESEKRVIVFVDCTHKTSTGQLWFQARGAY